MYQPLNIPGYKALRQRLEIPESRTFDMARWMDNCHPDELLYNPYTRQPQFVNEWVQIQADWLAPRLAFQWISDDIGPSLDPDSFGADVLATLEQLMPSLQSFVEGNPYALPTPNNSPSDYAALRDLIVWSAGGGVQQWERLLVTCFMGVIYSVLNYYAEASPDRFSVLDFYFVGGPPPIWWRYVPQWSADAWRQAVHPIVPEPEQTRLRQSFLRRWGELVTCRFPVDRIEELDIEPPDPQGMGIGWRVWAASKEGGAEIREIVGDAYEANRYDFSTATDAEDIYYEIEAARDPLLQSLYDKYGLNWSGEVYQDARDEVLQDLDEELSNLSEELAEDLPYEVGEEEE